MSAYRTAIDFTIETIENRARHYRYLIIAVVIITVVSVGTGIATGTFLPFSGLLLLLPSCSLFFTCDTKLLNKWHEHLLQSWVKKNIDFYGFKRAIDTISALPKDTLQGMLASLPQTNDLIAEHTVSSATREAIAFSVSYINKCQLDEISLKTMFFFIFVISLFFTFSISTLWLLMVIITVAIYSIVRNRLRRWRLKNLGEQLACAKKKEGFNKEIFDTYISALDFAEMCKR